MILAQSLSDMCAKAGFERKPPFTSCCTKVSGVEQHSTAFEDFIVMILKTI